MKLKNIEKAKNIAQEYGIIKGTLELLEKRKVKVAVKLTEKDDPDDVIVCFGNGFAPYITKAISDYKIDLERQIAAL
jgi:hypothetical protein